MAGPAHTFTTQRARDVIDKIIAYLTEHEDATVLDLAALIGVHGATVGPYLRHLRSLEIVHVSVQSITYNGGTTPARWALGKAQPALTRGLTGVRRQVIVRKQWEPNHARSMMDCLLFGTPAILGAAA